MTAGKKLKSTYRFTPDLDQIITQEAKKLGISKNAFVQMTLAKALEKIQDGKVATPDE
jgi:predicted HicB family RNase H-like nuclease